jgi:hypothetical protein
MSLGYYSKLNHSLDRSNYQILLCDLLVQIIYVPITIQDIQFLSVFLCTFGVVPMTRNWVRGSWRNYDKRHDFNFPNVNFPFICSNIPAVPGYISLSWFDILRPFSADNLCAYYHPGYTISISFSLHFWCGLLLLWVLILSTISVLNNYLHWKVTQSDNCFDQENNSTCCDANTSRQRTCSNGMTSFEKLLPLFRGHVQDWPLRFLHFWCDLMLWLLILSTITILFTICHELKIQKRQKILSTNIFYFY